MLAHADEAQVAVLDTVSTARAALLSEKQSLLVALKDLQSERDTGKLSEADFVELNARYRARALTVLKALDAQIAPHREEAKALLRAASEAAKPGSVASGSVASPLVEDVAAIGSCPDCSTVNDADAAFCKKCGAKLQSGAEAQS
jgi:rRNA maturation endonuclease Nob1